MPSQRKRIGFLPRLEVQNIIDQICKNNKLSQSKVTGILVEEALNSRGMLKSLLDTECNNINGNKKESLFINYDNVNYKNANGKNNYNLDESYINDEVQMINDFIEFKFFKKIMNKSKNKNNII